MKKDEAREYSRKMLSLDKIKEINNKVGKGKIQNDHIIRVDERN